MQTHSLYHLVFTVLLAYASFTGACTPQAHLPSYTMYDISYGADPQNMVDISLPEGRTRETPVVILIHGGAWISGDKSDFSFLREYLASRGYAVFAANYRLARITGTGFEDILDDIQRIIAFGKKKSREWTFSSETVFLAGHSAGGHIALLYAFTRDSGGAVRGVIAYCSPTDLTDPALKQSFDRLQMKDTPPGKEPFDLISFMTGPDPSLRREYSPVFIIKNVPVILFCGKQDKTIPWHQSAELHKKMKELGYDSTLCVYPDMGHDMTMHYKKIINKTEQWLRKRI